MNCQVHLVTGQNDPMCKMEPVLKLDPEEANVWAEIQDFRFTHPSRRGRIANFFWKESVRLFKHGAFVPSCIVAGIAAELAHKAKLCELGVSMRKPDGSYKSWRELTCCDERDEGIREMATGLRKSHRNMWVHADLEEIETFLERKIGFKSSDAEMNFALASGTGLELLKETKHFLLRLLQATG